MKSTYTIDKERRLIRVKFSGLVTVDDTIEHVDAVLADPDFTAGMDSISDLTGASFDWGLPDLDKFRAYVKKIKHLAGECKWALLASGGVTHLTARIFMTLHEAFEDTIEVRLFDNESAAESWIAGDGDA